MSDTEDAQPLLSSPSPPPPPSPTPSPRSALPHTAVRQKRTPTSASTQHSLGQCVYFVLIPLVGVIYIAQLTGIMHFNLPFGHHSQPQQQQHPIQQGGMTGGGQEGRVVPRPTGKVNVG